MRESKSKEDLIKNSLLFFLLRDSVPRMFSGRKEWVDCSIEEFNKDKSGLISFLAECADRLEGDVEAEFSKKELKDAEIVDNFILRPLNQDFKEILKKDYKRYLKDNLPQKLRKEILERDKYLCQYCGINLVELENIGFPAHIDHIKPRRSGGKHNPENLVACCWKCNLGKKDFDLFEYEDDGDNKG